MFQHCMTRHASTLSRRCSARVPRAADAYPVLAIAGQALTKGKGREEVLQLPRLSFPRHKSDTDPKDFYHVVCSLVKHKLSDQG